MSRHIMIKIGDIEKEGGIILRNVYKTKMEIIDMKYCKKLNVKINWIQFCKVLPQLWYDSWQDKKLRIYSYGKALGFIERRGTFSSIGEIIEKHMKKPSFNLNACGSIYLCLLFLYVSHVALNH